MTKIIRILADRARAAVLGIAIVQKRVRAGIDNLPRQGRRAVQVYTTDCNGLVLYSGQ